MTNTNVWNNTDLNRLQVTTPEGIALLDYRRQPDRLVLVHTEVPDEMEGQGIGGALVRAAVDLAVELDLPIEARCPFAREWLARHPDEAARAPQAAAG